MPLLKYKPDDLHGAAQVRQEAPQYGQAKVPPAHDYDAPYVEKVNLRNERARGGKLTKAFSENSNQFREGGWDLAKFHALAMRWKLQGQSQQDKHTRNYGHGTRSSTQKVLAIRTTVMH